MAETEREMSTKMALLEAQLAAGASMGVPAGGQREQEGEAGARGRDGSKGRNARACLAAQMTALTAMSR